MRRFRLAALLLALACLTSCGASARPGAPSAVSQEPEEAATFASEPETVSAAPAETPAPIAEVPSTLAGVPITLPADAEILSQSAEGELAELNFALAGASYCLRAKPTPSLQLLADVGEAVWSVPESETPVMETNRTRIETSEPGGWGVIWWYAQGRSFSLSTLDHADGDRLNALMEALNVEKVLTDFPNPPSLAVRAGDGTELWIGPGPGSWDILRADGSSIGMVACGEEPLAAYRMGGYPVIALSGGDLALEFEFPPVEITVQCWPAEDAADPEWSGAPAFLPVEEGHITVPVDGESVLQVSAVWDDGAGSGGSAAYCFCTAPAGGTYG